MSALLERFMAKVSPEPTSGCWLWLAGGARGYGQILSGEKMAPAHRVAWELFRGPISDGLFVCHKCDVRCCVNVDHLFLGTVQDNNSDKVQKGRQPRGETNGRALLSASDVLVIRHRCRSGETHNAVAASLGVTRSCVRSIVYGKTWRHVDGGSVPISGAPPGSG